VIRRVDLRGKSLNKAEINRAIPRAKLDVNTAMQSIAPILDEVKNGNEETLKELGSKFDGIAPKSIKVPKSVLESALANLDPTVRSSLEIAAKRIKLVHQDQVRNERTTQVEAGATVTERWIPVDRVGLYVPGGKAVYPSSVLMNVIPAQIAMVPSIAVASPPQVDNDGWPNGTILATCELLGINEVYAIGGAQAVALFAFGMDGLCEKVDLVTGPGNIYVAAAKRALRGEIGIDSEAGPTEIAILADETAIASDVAADLISQAEHDVIAAAVLVTNSIELADSVELELAKRVATAKHSERIRTALSGQQSAIVVVDNTEQGIEVVNAYAAEHLEIQTKNSKSDAALIRNAGAVFIGRFAPVSLGDYAAGSNHVLPTGGCACHSSGLSVQSFLRGLHFVEYDRESFTKIADTVINLANAEDLPAHGQAIEVRFENG
jgi:histidinol dehydrogenase